MAQTATGFEVVSEPEPQEQQATGFEVVPKSSYLQDAAEFANAFNQTISGGVLGDESTPRTKSQQIAIAAGRDAGMAFATLIPQFRAIKAAGMAPKLMQPGVIDGIRTAWLQALKQSPVGAAVLEVVSGGTSGAGGEIAEQFGLPRMAGQVAGGLVPGAAALGGQHGPIAQVAKGVGRVLGREGFEASQRGAVGKIISQSMDETAETNLKQADDVFRALGTEGRPTLAEGTRSPRLLRDQRQLENEASGQGLTDLVNRKRELAQQVVFNKNRPEMTGEPPQIVVDQIARAGRQRVARTRGNLKQQSERISDTQEAVARDLLPANDRIATGATLRQRRFDMRKEVADQMESKADDMGINDPEVQFDFRGFRQHVEDTYFKPASRFRDKARAPVIKEIRADAEDIVSFADMKVLRTKIGDQLSEAQFQGRKQDARELTKFKKQFDTWFENIDPTQGDPQLVQNWRAFRAEYKKDFIDRFDRGQAWKVGQRNKVGDYRIQDEKVAELFRHSESDARDFKRLFGDDPEALLSMRSAWMDDARTKVVRDGKVQPKLLVTYLRQNEKVLNEFPAIRDELSTIQSASKTLSNREAALTRRADVIQKSDLNKALNQPVNDIVPRAMKDPTLMKSIAQTAGRTGTSRQLKQAVWQEMMKDIDVSDGLPNPDSLRKSLIQNEASLKAALGPEHYGNLINIMRGLEVVGSTPLPRGASEVVGPLEKLEDIAGTGVQQISSRTFAVQSGRLSFRYQLVDAGARFINRLSKRRQQAMLQEALFNEELARDLATARTHQIISQPAINRRLNFWLYRLGVPQTEEEQ